MEIYNSDQILAEDELFELQDTFSCSGIPFQYQLTDGEYEWAKFIQHKYSISDYVLENTDENKVMTFTDPIEMSQALIADGCHAKAVMLSDETALQKLFFWLADGR